MGSRFAISPWTVLLGFLDMRRFAFAALLTAVLAIAPSCFAGTSAGGSTSSSVFARQNSYRQATYYPDHLNGHKTAQGDAFHQSAHTAASNKLPLGTTAKVTNLKTGKSTDVTVTDRGPALGSHKIDLTKKAAKDIGLTRKEGVAPVKIKVIGTPGAAGAGPGQ